MGKKEDSLEYWKNKQRLASVRCRELKKKQTKYEAYFELLLKKHKIHYISQKGFIKGNNFCIADFYLPKPYKIVIELDGEYHRSIKQIKRDKVKDRYYRSRGFNVVRFNNSDVFQVDTIDKLKQFMKNAIENISGKG